MNTFETPTWVKRAECRSLLDRFGIGKVVDAVPDDKIDEFALNLAQAFDYDYDDEPDEADA